MAAAAVPVDPLPPPPEGVPLDASRIAEVTTLAGSLQGFADGIGAAARFNSPKGLAIAPSGIVYVVDTNNNRIRQIDPATGAVSTLAGSEEGFADGVGAAAQFVGPHGIAVAPSGVVYVADTSNHMIRQIDPVTGAVTTLAGSERGFADGIGAAAMFNFPGGVAVAPSGVVYVADSWNKRICQIDPATGAVSTLAGSRAAGFADGVGADARFFFPKGIAVAPSGVVCIADTGNNRIRQIDPATGAVTTLAGSEERGFTDGVGAAARFSSPHSLVVAPSGVVYVSDVLNNRIRQIDPATGAVSTLAGSEEGFADGVGADARFFYPEGIAVAPSGIVYVADMHNHRIRQITFRANPGFVHMARKAVINSNSKFGALPENVVGDIFSYVGNTRGDRGGLHPRRAAAAAGAEGAEGVEGAGAGAEGAGGAMNELNRRNTRRRKTNRKANRKNHNRSRKTRRSRK